jgi:hypothetical protein
MTIDPWEFYAARLSQVIDQLVEDEDHESLGRSLDDDGEGWSAYYDEEGDITWH